VWLVILAPGIDVCRRRNATRDPQERFEFDGYEGLETDMKREFGNCAWWFDTAALTPEETAGTVGATAANRFARRPRALLTPPSLREALSFTGRRCDVGTQDEGR
jgi:hypothetical protein